MWIDRNMYLYHGNMKWFYYLQMYFVISIVYCDLRNHNMISNTDIDCGSTEIERSTRKFDFRNKIPDHSGLKKQHGSVEMTSMYPRRKKSRRRQKTGLAIPKTEFVSNCTEDQYYTYTTLSYEVDSIEIDQNVTTQPTEYIEEFTKPTTAAVTNASTIGTVTWSYQGNKSSEESDESKSTLIDYPFSVSIQKKGAHYASGAILGKFWIITAAGDFYNVRESLKLFRVRLGSVDCKSGGTLLPIKKIEIHPYYIHRLPNFDVALLRMAMYVDYNTFIRPIAISKIKGKVLSAKFMTTYWPRILVKGEILPQHARERVRFNSMRVSTQRLIPEKECAEIMKNISVVLNESTLCLKPVVTHHTICTPDVGAPVVAEDGLWGITSGWISPFCPLMAAPTLFTRLSSPSVLSWLDTHLDTL